jgi:hypothetical protein
MVVTTLLKYCVPDEKNSSDGSVEIGVNVVDLVVGEMVSRSDGRGPVTVGYCPVQYDTVVVMSGVGKTKLILVSPYAMTLVVRPRSAATEVTLAKIEELPTLEETDRLVEVRVDPPVRVLVCMVMNPVSELGETKLEKVFQFDEENVGALGVTKLELKPVVTLVDTANDNRDKKEDEGEDELVSRLPDNDDAMTGGIEVLNDVKELGEFLDGVVDVLGLEAGRVEGQENMLELGETGVVLSVKDEGVGTLELVEPEDDREEDVILGVV